MIGDGAEAVALFENRPHGAHMTADGLHNGLAVLDGGLAGEVGRCGGQLGRNLGRRFVRHWFDHVFRGQIVASRADNDADDYAGDKVIGGHY